jgi:hypothetical protein
MLADIIHLSHFQDFSSGYKTVNSNKVRRFFNTGLIYFIWFGGILLSFMSFIENNWIQTFCVFALNAPGN